MSSCSAQCIPCSTGSGWVEITRCIRTMLSWLTSNSLQTTAKTEGDWGSTRLLEKKTTGIESWSDVNSYSSYHIRSNSSLVLRWKTIFHKVVPKYPWSKLSVHRQCRLDWNAKREIVKGLNTSKIRHFWNAKDSARLDCSLLLYAIRNTLWLLLHCVLLLYVVLKVVMYDSRPVSYTHLTLPTKRIV